MKPYWSDSHRTVYNKSCTEMSEVSDNSIQCVVTSPPYWGLRQYAGNQDIIWDGNPQCVHVWGESIITNNSGGGWAKGDGSYNGDSEYRVPGNGSRDFGLGKVSQGNFCQICGAWRGAFGLEPSPELYVQHSIQILREIRRVLRPDGVCFWNIADSYYGSNQGYGTKNISAKQASNAGTLDTVNMIRKPNVSKRNILKPKDLVLIPSRVALVAQADGWYVRSDIIWSKPNPMPESMKDRPTDSYEHILMFTKSAKYYWDMEAVREAYTEPLNRWGGDSLKRDTSKTTKYKDIQKIGNSSAFRVGRPMRPNGAGRNIRNVWTLPKKGYSGAHFATFPEELPRRCIMAASKEGDTILDPFAGSGTTLKVAAELNRNAIGYEISEEYCRLMVDRNKQSTIWGNIR